MKTGLLAFLLFLFAIGNTNAQTKTRDFVLTPPTKKIQGSLYSTIDLLDSRKNKDNLGILHVGAFDAAAQIIPKTPLAIQLQSLLTAMTDSTVKNGTLLLQIRKFYLMEIPNPMSESGKFYFRACLYTKITGGYQLLTTIDTIATCESGIDVTKKLTEMGCDVVENFIAANLLDTPMTDQLYSDSDIAQVDSLEKTKEKLYTTGSYVNGVYTSFAAFRDQTPDYTELQVRLKDSSITGIKIKDSKGNFNKISSGYVYAVVYNGNAYAATPYGYYPLTKSDNDFYFTGKTKAPPTYAAMAGAQLMGGLLGAAAEANRKAFFYIKIDHLNGELIQLREASSVSDNNPD